MSTKRSHILKQTCSFQLQACLSMCDLLADTGILRLSKLSNKIQRFSNSNIFERGHVDFMFSVNGLFKKLQRISAFYSIFRAFIFYFYILVFSFQKAASLFFSLFKSVYSKAIIFFFCFGKRLDASIFHVQWCAGLHF